MLFSYGKNSTKMSCILFVVGGVHSGSPRHSIFISDRIKCTLRHRNQPI